MGERKEGRGLILCKVGHPRRRRLIDMHIRISVSSTKLEGVRHTLIQLGFPPSPPSPGGSS